MRLRGGSQQKRVRVSDFFTRGNSAVSLGTAASGQAYANILDTCGITANEGYTPSASTLAQAGFAQGLRAGCVEIVVATDTVLSTGVGVYLHYADSTHVLLLSHYSDNIYLTQDSGAGSSNIIAVIAPGVADGSKIQMRWAGANATIYLNGAAIGSTSALDTSFSYANKHIRFYDLVSNLSRMSKFTIAKNMVFA